MDKNLEFFETHLAELSKDYYGKYVIIFNESVIGSKDTFELAYDYAIKELHLEEGTFIIQHCVDPVTNVCHFAGNNIAFA
ncbi:MAG: hypothetical protein LBT45_03820 [Rickettsiales bacterium]|jgi:hypothetical protein|nr:hypothetical protein [Rickettsiales bacterium]